MEGDWKPAADAAMDRYAAGDDGAFSALYDLLAPRLRAFLFRRTRDPARADDLLQQTFLQMHCARRHFCRGAQVMPWSFAIARRLLIDGLRRKERQWIATDEGSHERAHDSEAPEPGPDEIAARHRITRRVQQELEHLPDQQRAAFELIQCDGLSIAEAAQVLGATETAVKLRAHRAYEALRAKLGDAAREELGLLAGGH